MILEDIIDIKSGQAQFRINETTDIQAPSYIYYSQANLEQDLCSSNELILSKQVRTFDNISSLLSTGDVIFSLISGKSARVSKLHQGFLYTQNYVKLTAKSSIDSDYLVYLLNENSNIQQQLINGLQGSQVLKYTTKQLKSLILPKLPSLKEQKLIGDIYAKQQKLTYLRQHKANLEKLFVLQQLNKVGTK